MNSIVSLDEIVELKKGSKLDFTTVQSLDSQRYIQIDDLRNDTNLKYTTGMGTGVDPDDVVIAWDGANAGTVGYGLSGVIGSTLVRLLAADPAARTVTVASESALLPENPFDVRQGGLLATRLRVERAGGLTLLGPDGKARPLLGRARWSWILPSS